MGMKLEVGFAGGRVQPWLRNMLVTNPTGAARFVADFAANVTEDKAMSRDEDEFLEWVETLCTFADVVFARDVARSVYKGYISPGDYTMGLRKNWQT